MDTKKQHKYIAFCIFTIILLSCSELTGSKDPIPSPTIHQQTSTAMPTGINPLPTTNVSPVFETIPTCQSRSGYTLASPDSVIDGTIIYQNDDFTGLYAIGGTPMAHSELIADETQQNIVFGVSPDGQWLAYSPFDSSNNAKLDQLQVILLSADGNRVENTLTTIQFEGDIQVDHQLVGVSAYSYWINTQLIYVTLYSQNPDPNTSGYISDLPKILDPFNVEWENQFLDLPERFQSDTVGISPDMSRALYKEYGLSLWDYDQKIQLWHDETLVTPYQALILWSPDSSMVAYANLYDATDDMPVLLITKDGVFKSILSKVFPLSDFGIRNLSWSPNSQYLALAGLDSENLNILIYDVSSGKYIIQCPIAKLKDKWPNLIWSPDSSRVAVSKSDSPILIVDISSGDVFELAQYGRVVGWSDKFPTTWP